MVVVQHKTPLAHTFLILEINLGGLDAKDYVAFDVGILVLLSPC
jgi:hypothetical protein